MTTPAIPICAECEHFQRLDPRHYSGPLLRCRRMPNPVTGHGIHSCESERRNAPFWSARKDRCGPEGQYFEPAPAPTPPRGWGDGSSPERPARIPPPTIGGDR